MWVAYGIIKDDIGWSTKKTKYEDGSSSYEILYIEGQYYPPELWDGGYVKEFESLSEAIDYVSKYRDESKIMIEKTVKEKFPKHYKSI